MHAELRSSSPNCRRSLCGTTFGTTLDVAIALSTYCAFDFEMSGCSHRGTNGFGARSL